MKTEKTVLGQGDTESVKVERVRGVYAYVRLLERYFDAVGALRLGLMDRELLQLERAVKVNRGKHTDKAVMVWRVAVSLLLSMVSSVAMAFVIVWMVNGVFNYPVAYSFKNIATVSLVFWIGKIRLNFSWKQ
jgi:hypothetical protein